MKEIRISVANLVNTINGKKIGILNHNRLNNYSEKVISAIGGGCELLNKNYFIDNFGAYKFEGEDARFIVSKAKADEVISFLSDKEAEKYIDFSIDRELEEELTTIELDGQEKPFINKEDLKTFKETNRFIDISESMSYKFNMYTIRYCVYHDFICSDEVLERLIDNKEVFVVSEEELKNKENLEGIEVSPNLNPPCGIH